MRISINKVLNTLLVGALAYTIVSTFNVIAASLLVLYAYLCKKFNNNV